MNVTISPHTTIHSVTLYATILGIMGIGWIKCSGESVLELSLFNRNALNKTARGVWTICILALNQRQVSNSQYSAQFICDQLSMLIMFCFCCAHSAMSHTHQEIVHPRLAPYLTIIREILENDITRRGIGVKIAKAVRTLVQREVHLPVFQRAIENVAKLRNPKNPINASTFLFSLFQRLELPGHSLLAVRWYIPPSPETLKSLEEERRQSKLANHDRNMPISIAQQPSVAS